MLPFLFIDLFILSSLCFQNKIEIILFAIMVLSTFLLIAVFPGVSSLIISEITDRDLFPSLKMKFIRIFPAAWTISSIVSYFIFWLFAFNYVYLSPIMYLIITNGYFVNIVSNIIAKSSISDHPISMLLRSLYLGLLIYNLIKKYYALLPFTKYGPGNLIYEYNLPWFIFFLIMHSVQIGILLAQWRYGSLFFLPNKFRAQTFDSYIQYVKEETIDSSENRWRLCTNSFCDPDLGYNDNKSSIKYTKITKLSYFHLPWGHNFHPKWILQRLEEKHWCPVWDKDVPKNVYLD